MNALEDILEIDELKGSLQAPLSLCAEQVPQGNLNRSVLFQTADGRPYLMRVESDEGRIQEYPNIIGEYTGVGFLENPNNKFFLRTPREQHAFADELLRRNIPAISPIFSREKMQIIAYCQGARNLADLWKTGSEEAIDATQKLFGELGRCHDAGIAIGDRWGPNELLLPDGSIKFIDFDIGIEGPEAREFELVACMYFLAFFAQQHESTMNLGEVQKLYSQLLSSNKEKPRYSREVLQKYLHSYPRYFDGSVPYSWKDSEVCADFFSDLHTYA